MDSRQSQSRSSFSVKKAFRRFEDLKAEFFKVHWTEDGNVRSYAKIVIVATFICGMVLYIADLIVQHALFGIDGLLRVIFG